MHMQNLIKYHQFIHKILSINEILMTTKDHNHVVNIWKLKPNNPNIDLVDINERGKFGLITSICSQDMKQKWNSNDNRWKIAKIDA